MQYFNERLPLPYLKIDKKGHIIGYCEEAWKTFNISSGKIADIIDEESRIKLYKFGFEQAEPVSMEVNIQTTQNALDLFEFHIVWDDSGYGNILLAKKDLANEKIVEKLSRLQQRLAETDFELFEKKEQLAQAMSRLHELSAPFIPISEEVCYIPIFGDITEEKVNVLSSNSLHNIFSGSYDKVLLDFTAVGEIESQGIEKLSILFKTMYVMIGSVINIIGVTPGMAKSLNQYHLEEYVRFESSLKKVLSQSDNGR
jgi:rsbT co-antagonist protein RsbR